jgi:extracellular elastinolytic metalloproteinase
MDGRIAMRLTKPKHGSLVLAASMAALIAMATGLGDEARAATATETGFAVPGTVHRGNGQALHAPSGAGMPATVADFLASKGRGAATVGSLRVKREMAVGDSGTTVIDLTQEVDGLAVYGVQARAIFDSDGNLITLSENVVAAGPVAPAAVGPRAALDAALGEVHPGLAVALLESGGSGNSTSFGGDDFFFKDPNVTRIAIPVSSGALQEGFLVETWSEEDNQLNYTLVAGNGRVLYVQSRTNNACPISNCYNVFAIHPEVADQAELTGLPGWLTGSQTTVNISGRNVHAYLDTTNNNDPDPVPVGTSVIGGLFPTFADLDSDPSGLNNQAVAVQNLFYLNNIIHDELSLRGFDQAAANFEGDDPVLAEAQDGSGMNNANFSTPIADGDSPRMQMYLWDYWDFPLVPRRDGDLDADIVWHEYGHGLTWRVVGNMGGNMGGAVGEGASDALSIVMTNNDRTGEYATGVVGGIRSNAYDTYLSDTGRTYESIADNWSSIHYNGEIYAAIIWDMWKRYRSDLAPGGVTATLEERRSQMMTDMVDGMLLTTLEGLPSTTFPAMRNGILRSIAGFADSADPADPNNAGSVANENLSRWCHAWQAFAKYGVGVSQSTSVRMRGPRITWSWTEAFDVPAECEGPPPPNEAPTAAFSSNCSGLTCNFTDESTDPNGDATIATWTWDFGDGYMSPQNNPSHTYAFPSTYTVTLTVDDVTLASDPPAMQGVVVTDPGPTTSMHVGDLDDLSTSDSRRWAARVMITVYDSDEGVVADATVNGSWSGSAKGGGSCTTDIRGQCTVSKGVKNGAGDATFAVTSVTHATLTYDDADNHDEPDTDFSDGSTITVVQP